MMVLSSAFTTSTRIMPSAALAASQAQATTSSCLSLFDSTASDTATVMNSRMSSSTSSESTKSVCFSSTAPQIHYYIASSSYFKNGAKKSDLYISAREQAKMYHRIRHESSHPSWSRVGALLLQDIHDIAVPQRIERMVQLHYNLEQVRGLESLICVPFKKLCIRQRQRAIQTVLDHQDAIRDYVAAMQRIQVVEEGKVNNNKAAEFQEQTVTSIAKVAMEQSHNARVMARILALADQQYVRQACHQQNDGQENNDNTDTQDETPWKGRPLSLLRRTKSESELLVSIRSVKDHSSDADDDTTESSWGSTASSAERHPTFRSSRRYKTWSIKRVMRKLGQSVTEKCAFMHNNHDGVFKSATTGSSSTSNNYYNNDVVSPKAA